MHRSPKGIWSVDPNVPVVPNRNKLNPIGSSIGCFFGKSNTFSRDADADADAHAGAGSDPSPRTLASPHKPAAIFVPEQYVNMDLSQSKKARVDFTVRYSNDPWLEVRRCSAEESDIHFTLHFTSLHTSLHFTSLDSSLKGCTA